ncbi:DUF3103 family protein [Xanthovirga aplysinae]|uniref:DUF3103 family protein n=1 Tax=Xanthovirga aplysinae TaxID=2529853 RepID=UPI0012BD12A3|nr:DUF3103 family protein [Xanthovirga aplysinae]MTI31385.1 DUF3103 family protein [Xanthovirga aplysinae]
MKTTKVICILVLGVILISTSCQRNEEVVPAQLDQENQQNGLDKSEMSLQLSQLLQNHANLSATIPLLQENKRGVELRDVLENMEEQNEEGQSFNRLQQMIEDAENQFQNIKSPKRIEVPEVWLHEPSASFELEDLLIAFAPKGNERDWDKITAYNLKQEVVYLDINQAPNRPVLVVETDGFEALKIKVDRINQRLQEHGLQKESLRKGRQGNLEINNALETTVLDAISLADNKEPWIKGASEVYAVTSGIRAEGDDKEAQINVIAMQYLDNQGETYYPNQVVLFWDDYDYQAANIQLFEQDSNYNYEELVTILVEGVFTITGILTELPWLSALGEIAGAIIEAMPDDFWTDDDDYIDSFYTIQKDRSYNNLLGAGKNATISLSPLTIEGN